MGYCAYSTLAYRNACRLVGKPVPLSFLILPIYGTFEGVTGNLFLMMIFDFRLHVFHTVARRLSFTRAAEELFITQPAVTKHIRVLEQQLGVTLFERQGNSVVLTESGKILLRYARKIETLYSNLEEDINALSGMVKGRLSIGASTTIAQYLLPEMLAAFSRKHPEVSLQIMTGNTEQVEQAMRAGDIDLGFIEGNTRNRQLKYVPFRKDEIVLVAKAGHHLSAAAVLRPADLQKASFVMREQGSGTLAIVMQALKKAGIQWSQLNIALHLDSTEAIKSYLLHSDCLAFVSTYAVRGTPAGLFSVIPVKGLRIERPLNAIHLQGTPPRMASLFLKFALGYNKK